MMTATEGQEYLMLQKILSRVRKAVEDYNMIHDGDKLAIGVSGGKDSQLLLAMKNFGGFT